MASQSEVTQILREASAGDRAAMNRLLPLVYDELRRLAQSRLARERSDHTIQATALVHEAYLRLIDQTRVQWQNRAHFFAVAAQAIRRILIDYARARGSEKRGGEFERIAWEDALLIPGAEPRTDVLALDAALRDLERLHPEKARVVEMRFFGGLTCEESAAVLGIGVRTAERYWQYARAWLYRELTGGSAGEPAP